jgi:hypothetical protein
MSTRGKRKGESTDEVNGQGGVPGRHHYEYAESNQARRTLTDQSLRTMSVARRTRNVRRMPEQFVGVAQRNQLPVQWAIAQIVALIKRGVLPRKHFCLPLQCLDRVEGQRRRGSIGPLRAATNWLRDG